MYLLSLSFLTTCQKTPIFPVPTWFPSPRLLLLFFFFFFFLWLLTFSFSFLDLFYAHKLVDITPFLQERIEGMYIGHKQVYLGLGFTHEAREKYR